MQPEPPRIPFLVFLLVGFLATLTWVLLEQPPDREGSREFENQGTAARTPEPSGPEPLSEADRALYSPEALALEKQSLLEVDIPEWFRTDELPRILETNRFDLSRLGMTLDERKKR